MNYLNRDCIDHASEKTFQSQPPYPWMNFQGSLTPEAFDRLRATLPDISIFDRKVGVKRGYGQGSHDRYLLHYRPNLPIDPAWQEFINELQGPTYQSFLRRMLGVDKQYICTFEWYYAWQGCSVSPHCDARRKLATHIFYFNTEADWDTSWGGQVLMLDDEKRFRAHSAPKFDDFKVAASIDPRGNGSLLFQRTDHSWHGVRPLAAPADHFRKLFIVTINIPTVQVWWRRVRGKDPDGYLIAGAN